MVDIHSHVLPGVDDGAPDLETAVAMCRMAAEAGTTDLVATPHHSQRYPYDPGRVATQAETLRRELGGLLHLHLGCDLQLNLENVDQALDEPERFTINGNGYLLVEFSESILVQGTASIFEKLRDAGIRPVVTHPERNHFLRRDLRRLSRWVERGCLFQVTGQSLLGEFGDGPRDAAIRMMDARLVHFVASDGHNLNGRPPVLDATLDFLIYRWGKQAAQTLLIDNPWAALWGQVIDPPEPKRRKWWQLG